MGPAAAGDTRGDAAAAAALPDEESEEPAAVDRRRADPDSGPDRKAAAAADAAVAVARGGVSAVEDGAAVGARRRVPRRLGLLSAAGTAPPPTGRCCNSSIRCRPVMSRTHQPARRWRCHPMDDAWRSSPALSRRAAAHLRQESRSVGRHADCQAPRAREPVRFRPTESGSRSSRARR